ncbi:MAG: biopolymer transporter ExbD [Verrucomicrobiota bacterium]|nr:biopolymer transporter ExbD [Verrucomicrobiota bacterium]
MRNNVQPTLKPARVEIIPLIDVIFFLLACFVLISLTLTRHLGMPLEFPAPSREGSPDSVTIQVTAEGKLLWNLDPIESMEALGVAITAYKNANPNARILIQGEAASPFGMAVAILDEARHLGVRQVSMQTKVVE